MNSTPSAYYAMHPVVIAEKKKTVSASKVEKNTELIVPPNVLGKISRRSNHHSEAFLGTRISSEGERVM